MKISISRQHIYLMSISIFLFLFVLIFSFSMLIPAGKEYRIKRVELKKVNKEFRKYANFHDDTVATLQELRSENRHIITAFDKEFSAYRFEKQHKNYFSKLSISKLEFIEYEDEKAFSVYEVKTSSQISSPSSFYNFLDALNKSDWIISIDFPIDFVRDGELIKSSFTMKVYANTKETNSSVSTSEAK